MIFEELCAPAALNLAFSLVQIIIDISKRMYNSALIKFFIAIIFTIILNIICEKGFEVISWIVVFLPFIFMTVITTILLFIFGLNPDSGNYKYSIQIPQKIDDVSRGIPINRYTDSVERQYRDAKKIMRTQCNDGHFWCETNKKCIPDHLACVSPQVPQQTQPSYQTQPSDHDQDNDKYLAAINEHHNCTEGYNWCDKLNLCIPKSQTCY